MSAPPRLAISVNLIIRSCQPLATVSGWILAGQRAAEVRSPVKIQFKPFKRTTQEGVRVLGSDPGCHFLTIKKAKQTN